MHKIEHVTAFHTNDSHQAHPSLLRHSSIHLSIASHWSNRSLFLFFIFFQPKQLTVLLIHNLKNTAPVNYGHRARDRLSLLPSGLLALASFPVWNKSDILRRFDSCEWCMSEVMWLNMGFLLLQQLLQKPVYVVLSFVLHIPSCENVFTIKFSKILLWGKNRKHLIQA